MTGIRWHGRGGQGAVTAARIFGLAVAKYSNRFAQSFPAFGVERRGAPVLAFTKIDQEPILDRSHVLEPDMVVVLDAGLLSSVDVTAGLKERGLILINARETPEELAHSRWTVIAIDATEIALQGLGRAITNTAMVGALAAITGLASLEAIEKAVNKAVPAKVVEKNIHVVDVAYQEAMSARAKERTEHE